MHLPLSFVAICKSPNCILTWLQNLAALTLPYQNNRSDMKKLMLRIRFSHSRVGPPESGRAGERHRRRRRQGRMATKRAGGQVVIKCAQKTLSDPNRVFRSSCRGLVSKATYSIGNGLEDDMSRSHSQY